MTGLAGGLAHCTWMCGGFVIAFARLWPEGRPPAWAVAGFHLGRITTYALLAALLAWSGLQAGVLAPSGTRRILALVAGLVMLLLALRLIRPRGTALGKAGRWWSRRLAGLFRGAARLGPAAPLATGLAWGLLPCGFSWGAIVGAASSAPAVAPWTAAAFGAGTIAPLLLTGWTGTQIAGRFGGRVRWLAGAALALWALWLIGMAIAGGGTAAHMGHGGH